MAIIYINKTQDGNWKASNIKDGKAFLTVSTKEQAIKRVNLQKGVTGLMIKEGKEWISVDSTNGKSNFTNPSSHRPGNGPSKLNKAWQKTGIGDVYQR